jgi:AbiU2
MKVDPEKEFEHELSVFGSEVNEAIQSFYAEQTIHNLARRDRQAFEMFNRHAAFWNLTARALQSNALIALGRVFDKDLRSHSIFRLLRLASEHREIFSRAALEKRKRPQAGQWTDEFMRSASIPREADLARLLRYVDKQQGIYEGS